MRIALGMSGGVDSTVAACLLRAQGHTVIGVTMQIWDGRFQAEPLSPSGTAAGMPCQSGCYGPGEPQVLAHTAALARRLGLEHHIVPLAAEYRRLVLDYFTAEYLAGRTPNPCVVCNRAIKFGLLPERLRAAGVEFDAFATGHYARVGRNPQTGLFDLRRGADRLKDQSYFLFYLNQQQLGRLILPLGDMTKVAVKELARQYGLQELTERSESQDFMGGADYGALFQPAAARPGPIVDEAGRVLGEHRGIIHYTIGQREGLGIAAGHRLFVKELRPETNTIVLAERTAVMRSSCMVENVRWIAGSPPEMDAQAGSLHYKRRAEEAQAGSLHYKGRVQAGSPCRQVLCRVQLRYRHAGAPAALELLEAGRVRVSFDAPQFAVTPGQAAVFYRDDEVLGGGWIGGPG